MKLKIHFVDFWPLFNLHDNFFVDLLKSEYDIVFDSVNPDILFFSVFGCKHWSYNCKKIFFTGENIRPDFTACDYSFSFDFDTYGGKNFRLPLYAFYSNPKLLTEAKNPEEILKSKSAFCNFIYSNARGNVRNRFFNKLSKYQKIDSGGKVFNNLGYRVSDKISFLKKYKFTIAFENESYPGYTTEKIFEPMLANSIPVYWGNELIAKDFNEKSFLSYHNFANEDDLIDRIIEIDKNDDLYLQMLNEPWFENNQINDFVNPEKITANLRHIIESDYDCAKRDFSKSRQFLLKKEAEYLLNTYIYKKIRRFSWNQLLIKYVKKHPPLK